MQEGGRGEELSRISSLIQMQAVELIQSLLAFDVENRSFIELELSLCHELNQLGAKVLELVIPTLYGNGYRGPRVEVDEETSYSCVARKRERGLLTAFGKISLTRAVYTEYHSGGLKSFLDERLCIEDKKHCPLIRYWSDLLGTVAPFAEASDVLNKMRGIQVSRKQVESSTESMGTHINKLHQEQIDAVILDEKGRVPPAYINLNLNAEHTIYIETDGCHINTKDGWKECKTFMLFEIEKLSEDSQLLKNKFYYSTMESVAELKRQLKFHLDRYCGTESVRIVCIGDGAKWIWKSMQELFPEDRYPSGIIEIVDWYHAIENLSEMFKDILPKNTSVEGLVKPYEEYLHKGNLEQVDQDLTTLMNKQTTPDKRNRVYETIKYFTRNKEKMRYDCFRELGLCVGSGAIESANKYVIQRRIKLPGMRWERQNANAMAHLRAEYINGLMEGHYNIRENPLIGSIAVT